MNEARFHNASDTVAIDTYFLIEIQPTSTLNHVECPVSLLTLYLYLLVKATSERASVDGALEGARHGMDGVHCTAFGRTAQQTTSLRASLVPVCVSREKTIKKQGDECTALMRLDALVIVVFCCLATSVRWYIHASLHCNRFSVISTSESITPIIEPSRPRWHRLVDRPLLHRLQAPGLHIRPLARIHTRSPFLPRPHHKLVNHARPRRVLAPKTQILILAALLRERQRLDPQVPAHGFSRLLVQER